MRYIFSDEILQVPKGVKVSIKARVVTVEGPRGKLTKDLGHISVRFAKKTQNTLQIVMHHGARKNVAALRTVKSLISNLVTGVTKGYQYKMRLVYAHFPINVSFNKLDSGRTEVEIRNFLGEKFVRRVVLKEGVDIVLSTAQKDELILTGSSLENVSQSAADIQQTCRVTGKDIRKFLDGIYVSARETLEQE